MTNIDFIEFALSHAKPASVPIGAMLAAPLASVGDAGEWEYLYGTTGHKITPALLNAKFNTYYSNNGWTREEYDKVTVGFVGRIACDCQGLLDKSCGMDITANDNWLTCTKKGKIDPNENYVIGECLFIESKTTGKKTHVGFVCGFMPNGEELIVEERGIRYGCVVTKRFERPWTHHGRATKYLDYIETVKLYGAEPKPFTLGEKSDDVKKLQELLTRRCFYGSDGMPLKIDGEFGERTAEALNSFISAQYPVKVLVGENVVYTNKEDK